MGIKTFPQPPYCPDLAPCDFWLFPKLRGCHYETIEEMKEAVTLVLDTLTQEDFHEAFQKFLERYKQVHCSQRRLLRKGLEFHVCTINKSAHTKKSGNLFNDSCTKVSPTSGWFWLLMMWNLGRLFPALLGTLVLLYLVYWALLHIRLGNSVIVFSLG